MNNDLLGFAPLGDIVLGILAIALIGFIFSLYHFVKSLSKLPSVKSLRFWLSLIGLLLFGSVLSIAFIR